MAYNLYWSEEALSNLSDILNYLESNWSETEIIVRLLTQM